MKRSLFRNGPILGGVLLTSLGFVVAASSQTPGLNAGRQTIEERKSVFKLIGANFRPLGNILKGTAQYDATVVDKAISRTAFLTSFLDETAFTEASNLGDPETKAKADIWTKRAEFDKRLKDFQTHVQKLKATNDTDKDATEAFKTALNTVAQDCKSCHDDFRVK